LYTGSIFGEFFQDHYRNGVRKTMSGIIIIEVCETGKNFFGLFIISSLMLKIYTSDLYTTIFKTYRGVAPAANLSQPYDGTAEDIILQIEDLVGKYRGVVALNIRLSIIEKGNKVRKP
jgi:hypothetical protein